MFFICLNVVIITLSVLGLYFVVAKVSMWGTVIGTIVFTIQVASYALTALINPGLQNRKLSLYDQLSIDRIVDTPYAYRPQTTNPRELYCKICNTIKKRGSFTYHCEECNVCVEGRMRFADSNDRLRSSLSVDREMHWQRKYPILLYVPWNNVDTYSISDYSDLYLSVRFLEWLLLDKLNRGFMITPNHLIKH